jgi:hypothetical protein
MIRNWYGDRCFRKMLLHDNVAAALAHLYKSMLGKNAATCFPERR